MTHQAYHHGDLKNALVQAGLMLLETGGPAAVSLRAVAREAGVSQAAPYAHFADKRALMTSIAARGFEKLRDTLQPLASDAAGSLSEIGLAYVDFASANPGLYSLMFGSNEHVDPHDPELIRASGEAFRPLAEKTVAGHADAASDPAPIAAWSLVHGFATLLINEKLQPGRRDMLPEVLRLLAPGLSRHLDADAP